MFRRKLKVVSGNYTEVMRALGLPVDKFTQPMTQEKYDEMIEKDFHRSYMFCTKGQRSELKLLWQTRPQGVLSYSQGDFSAGIFTNIALFKSAIFTDPEEAWRDLLSQKSQCLHPDLNFSYLNDDGVLCGFALLHFCDIRQEKKEYFFNLALITHANAEPEQREVLFISDSFLLPVEAKKNQMRDINKREAFKLVAKTLRSKAVLNFFQPFFRLSDEEAFKFSGVFTKCFVKPDNFGFYFNPTKEAPSMDLLLSGFEESLCELEEKIDNLYERGFEEASKEASVILALLKSYKQGLLEGKINRSDFIQYCREATKIAADSELNYHREGIGRLLNFVLTALNKLSCGWISVKLTDSMLKITEIDRSLFKLSFFSYLPAQQSYDERQMMVNQSRAERTSVKNTL